MQFTYFSNSSSSKAGIIPPFSAKRSSAVASVTFVTSPETVFFRASISLRNSDEYIDKIVNNADEKMYNEKRQIKKDLKVLRIIEKTKI